MNTNSQRLHALFTELLARYEEAVKDVSDNNWRQDADGSQPLRDLAKAAQPTYEERAETLRQGLIDAFTAQLNEVEAKFPTMGSAVYDAVSAATGIDRSTCKRVLLSYCYSGQVSSENQGLTSDQSVAIGEHAFRAGYDSAAARARAFHPIRIESDAAHREKAWSEYDPPEELKGL